LCSNFLIGNRLLLRSTIVKIAPRWWLPTRKKPISPALRRLIGFQNGFGYFACGRDDIVEVQIFDEDDVAEDHYEEFDNYFNAEEESETIDEAVDEVMEEYELFSDTFLISHFAPTDKNYCGV